MDLSLTETQEMLRNTARDFLKRECPWTLVKEIDESESGFSAQLWSKTAGLGWLAMDLPEEYGGMGTSIQDLGILYEEMGQALLPGPYFSEILCASLILGVGTEAQKKALLPAIAQGEKILALALTEPDYGWDPECIHLTATAKGGNYVLNGTKRFVHDAQIADQIVCVARTKESRDPADGITLFLVDKNAPGISCRDLVGFTGEKLNEVTFKAVEVPAANILGEKDKGWAALAKPMDRTSLLLCAYMLGGCQHLLDMTVEYAQTRVQFGQPIGAFQWVQGYIIGQANYLEKARWLTYEALWKVDANKPQSEQDESISLAKAMVSESFHECGHLAHEVHAGVGVDKKFPLYLYSKKAKTMYSYLGDPTHHRKRVAQVLGL
ncbi:MAG: acyl-CoA dehydrogenase family protein [Dehalococcoidales bacterium]|nr:acyl-CoA dehydrogenase family protein [Dehalococcoidales bacterium]